jgi:hypothetical protein
MIISFYFFSGIAGVTGCEPPVDAEPAVTPALFSFEPLELMSALESVFGLAPFVGPLPASTRCVVTGSENVSYGTGRIAAHRRSRRLVSLAENDADDLRTSCAS